MFAARQLAARTLARQAPRAARRNMGGHAAPPAEGWEGAVRAKLPEDHQIVLAMLGTYGVLFLFSKLGGSKAEPAPVAAAAPAEKTDIPSVLSEEWAEWSAQGNNLEIWEKSLENWEPTEAWEKSLA